MAGAELDPELEVLSWNIQKAGTTGWSEDLASIAGNADLVFIQEASTKMIFQSAYSVESMVGLGEGEITQQ